MSPIDGGTHLLPAGAAVPSVTEIATLTDQIDLNAGVDDAALAAEKRIARFLARSSYRGRRLGRE